MSLKQTALGTIAIQSTSAWLVGTIQLSAWASGLTDHKASQSRKIVRPKYPAISIVEFTAGADEEGEEVFEEVEAVAFGLVGVKAEEVLVKLEDDEAGADEGVGDEET